MLEPGTFQHHFKAATVLHAHKGRPHSWLLQGAPAPITGCAHGLGIHLTGLKGVNDKPAWKVKNTLATRLQVRQIMAAGHKCWALPAYMLIGEPLQNTAPVLLKQ